jgi:hypothetical protein
MSHRLAPSVTPGRVEFSAGGVYRERSARVPTVFRVTDTGSRIRAVSRDGRKTFDIATFPVRIRTANLAEAKMWFNAWQGTV